MSSSVFEMEATNATGGDYESPPPGSHTAVCVAIVDLGTHEEDFKGERKENRKVLIAWELPHQIQSNGDPFVKAAAYNASPKLGRKSGLRKMLEAWRGGPYNDQDKVDLRKLILRPALLNLVEKASGDGSKKYINIEAVIPVPKGTQVPKPFHEPFLWSDLSNPFEGPEWLPWHMGKPLGDFIEESMEARGIPTTDKPAKAPGRDGDPIEDDDIPF